VRSTPGELGSTLKKIAHDPASIQARVSPYEKVLCGVKRTVQSTPMPQHPAAVFKERR
jgi:hypothetical protein